VVLASAGWVPCKTTTAAVAESTSSCGSSRDAGEPGRVAVQVPAGSFIRSTSGRHELLVTGGQDSAHSHPPALAAATTGAGNGCAAQVVPALPVSSSGGKRCQAVLGQDRGNGRRNGVDERPG
jgi:hypothetical protein